jgi:hypothetical protein
MAASLEEVAKNLSFLLGEEIHVENDCIVLGGVESKDYAFLQLGANDGCLYFSAPIVDIDEETEFCDQYLSTLLELNGDTKNYPRGRIAYSSIGGAAHWIEVIEDELSAQDLLALIKARGEFIANIRFALKSLQKA